MQISCATTLLPGTWDGAATTAGPQGVGQKVRLCLGLPLSAEGHIRMLGVSLFLRTPTQSVFGKMKVSLPAIQDMKYGEDLGTRYGLTVEEGGLGNGRNPISESKGLSPGKPNPGHPVSLAFLPGSCLPGAATKTRQRKHFIGRRYAPIRGCLPLEGAVSPQRQEAGRGLEEVPACLYCGA